MTRTFNGTEVLVCSFEVPLESVLCLRLQQTDLISQFKKNSTTTFYLYYLLFYFDDFRYIKIK
jgi:hypothetical protein